MTYPNAAWRLVLWGFLVWAASLQPAGAYIQYTAKTGERLAWPSEHVTVYVNMGCPTDAPCWNALTTQAIDEWNAVNASFFIEAKVGAAEIPTACREQDQLNTVQWAAARCNGDPWDDADNPVRAYTWFTYQNRTGHILEADMRFDETRAWSAAQFYDTMLHELGHLIGLDHPNEHDQEVRAIMNVHNPVLDGLQLDDRHGIRGIYGTVWWADSDYPTETLGAWELIHPESGKPLVFTLTHIREYAHGIWARTYRDDGIVWAARGDALGETWWTHYFSIYADASPVCLRMWVLYEGPEMFTGRLSIGHTKDEDGRCTVWPDEGWSDVELYRD